jgi:hypothetical protein
MKKLTIFFLLNFFINGVAMAESSHSKVIATLTQAEVSALTIAYDDFIKENNFGFKKYSVLVVLYSDFYCVTFADNSNSKITRGGGGNLIKYKVSLDGKITSVEQLLSR